MGILNHQSLKPGSMKIGEADACPLRRGRLELRNHMCVGECSHTSLDRTSFAWRGRCRASSAFVWQFEPCMRGPAFWTPCAARCAILNGGERGGKVAAAASSSELERTSPLSSRAFHEAS
eukprot:scaffold2730_cov247-Pinguiococcus_pyrenoidosus.AAC.1